MSSISLNLDDVYYHHYLYRSSVNVKRFPHNRPATNPPVKCKTFLRRSSLARSGDLARSHARFARWRAQGWRPSRARLSTPPALPRALPSCGACGSARTGTRTRPQRRYAPIAQDCTESSQRLRSHQPVGRYGQARFRFYTDLYRRDSATTPREPPVRATMCQTKRKALHSRPKTAPESGAIVARKSLHSAKTPIALLCHRSNDHADVLFLALF
jgi:hypothetical protein